MSEKNKLKSELILEVEQLKQRIKELESGDNVRPGTGSGSNWDELADSSPDYITALASDLTIQYVNHPSPGLSKDDLIGRSITSFVDDEKSEEVGAILQEVILTGKPAIYETEFQIPGADGGIIYYETHALPRKSNDKVIGLILNSRDITHRKQVEDELKKERDKLQSTFRSAPIGIGVVANRIIVQANEFFCEMMGYASEELINQDARILYLSQDDYDYVGEEKYKQINKFGVGTVETRLRRKNGEIIDVLLSSSPVDLEDFESGITFSALDITERKRVEGALKENQRQLSILMGNLPGMAYRCKNDPSFTMEYVSSGVEPLTEYASEDLVNNQRIAFSDIIHPDDLEMVRDNVQSSLEKNAPFQLIYRIITSTGIEKWVWEQGEGILNELDEIVALEGFISDISELKKAEIELAHSHDLMNYIIEYNWSAIAVLDKDLNYIYVSKRYLEESRAGEQNVIGKHHYDVFPDLPQKWRDLNQKVLAGEIVRAENDPFIRDDGNVDWTRWESRPWYEADGTIGGIIIYTEVITERIQEGQEKDRLLRELKEANDRLKSLSRELINSQEAERQRISQELHDEFGQALTAISLDLGIIERELTPGCPTNIKKRVSDTREMADELDQMIGELALDLRPSLLDDLGLLPTLNWYVDRFSKRAEIKAIIESVGSDKRLPSEIETALYRIVQEALTNVAKHSGAEKVILNLNQQPKTISLSIEDDGRGFDMKELQNANVPFQGLGLIGMGDRTALLGGRLDIQSNPGQGTRIEVEIPL